MIKINKLRHGVKDAYALGIQPAIEVKPYSPIKTLENMTLKELSDIEKRYGAKIRRAENRIVMPKKVVSYKQESK